MIMSEIKYDLSIDEIAFIENMIRPMEIGE